MSYTYIYIYIHIHICAYIIHIYIYTAYIQWILGYFGMYWPILLNLLWLLPVSDGLLWGVVADYFGLLGFPGREFLQSRQYRSARSSLSRGAHRLGTFLSSQLQPHIGTCQLPLILQGNPKNTGVLYGQPYEPQNASPIRIQMFIYSMLCYPSLETYQPQRKRYVVVEACKTFQA